MALPVFAETEDERTLYKEARLAVMVDFDNMIVDGSKIPDELGAFGVAPETIPIFKALLISVKIPWISSKDPEVIYNHVAGHTIVATAMLLRHTADGKLLYEGLISKEPNAKQEAFKNMEHPEGISAMHSLGEELSELAFLIRSPQKVQTLKEASRKRLQLVIEKFTVGEVPFSSGWNKAKSVLTMIKPINEIVLDSPNHPLVKTMEMAVMPMQDAIQSQLAEINDLATDRHPFILELGRRFRSNPKQMQAIAKASGFDNVDEMMHKIYTFNKKKGGVDFGLTPSWFDQVRSSLDLTTVYMALAQFRYDNNLEPSGIFYDARGRLAYGVAELLATEEFRQNSILNQLSAGSRGNSKRVAPGERPNRDAQGKVYENSRPQHPDKYMYSFRINPGDVSPSRLRKDFAALPLSIKVDMVEASLISSGLLRTREGILSMADSSFLEALYKQVDVTSAWVLSGEDVYTKGDLFEVTLGNLMRKLNRASSSVNAPVKPLTHRKTKELKRRSDFETQEQFAGYLDTVSSFDLVGSEVLVDFDGQLVPIALHSRDDKGTWNALTVNPVSIQGQEPIIQNISSLKLSEVVDTGSEVTEGLSASVATPVETTEASVKAQPVTTPWTRNSVKQDTDNIYIFTDNTDRTSGKGEIPEDSWYSKKYGKGLKYPSMTQAVIRGLDNVRPISTMKHIGSMADAKAGRTQWQDTAEDLALFKETIDAEVADILEAVAGGKGLMYSRGGVSDRIGQGKISKLPAPHQEYLDTKLLELGIDNAPAGSQAPAVETGSQAPAVPTMEDINNLLNGESNSFAGNLWPVSISQARTYAAHTSATRAYPDTRKGLGADERADLIQKHKKRYNDNTVIREIEETLKPTLKDAEIPWRVKQQAIVDTLAKYVNNPQYDLTRISDFIDIVTHITMLKTEEQIEEHNREVRAYRKAEEEESVSPAYDDNVAGPVLESRILQAQEVARGVDPAVLEDLGYELTAEIAREIPTDVPTKVRSIPRAFKQKVPESIIKGFEKAALGVGVVIRPLDSSVEAANISANGIMFVADRKAIPEAMVRFLVEHLWEGNRLLDQPIHAGRMRFKSDKVASVLDGKPLRDLITQSLRRSVYGAPSLFANQASQ